MKAGSSNRLIVSILVVAGLALAFWMLLLSPKREEADKLSSEAGQLQVALSEAQAKAAQAATAQQEFPSDYRQLVVLGQAVPAGEETSSLLVELNTIAAASHVRFNNLQLESSGTESAAATAPTPSAPAPSSSPSSAVPASSTIPPTEAAASLMPLGAAIGPAGLGVLPYGLTFSGNFFQIANFIKGVDSLVDTKADTSKIGVDGRLVTLNGFSLTTEEGEEEKGSSKSPTLTANFSVTTYVTPPSQGTTAGATAAAPVTSAAGASSAATATASATESPSEAGMAR